MLNIQIGGDHTGIHVEASGKNSEILTELAIAFNVIYHSMVGADPEESGNFKDMLKLAMTDDNSPFWKDLGLDLEDTAQLIEVPET